MMARKVKNAINYEDKIVDACWRLKTLKPLIYALKLGHIKFRRLNTFNMKSLGGHLTFEDDIYWYGYMDKCSFTQLDVFARKELDTAERLMGYILRNERGI